MQPLILKDIADEIDMDVSTVSRVANSKFVQTEFGTKRLKDFFSESLQTQDGEEAEISDRTEKRFKSTYGKIPQEGSCNKNQGIPKKSPQKSPSMSLTQNGSMPSSQQHFQNFLRVFPFPIGRHHQYLIYRYPPDPSGKRLVCIL